MSDGGHACMAEKVDLVGLGLGKGEGGVGFCGGVETEHRKYSRRSSVWEKWE